MFFQVSVSPLAKPKKVDIKEVEEPEEALILAPFTPTPKLFFEKVTLGTNVTKKLILKNPTRHPVEIHLTQIPPKERCVTFNWFDESVPGNSEINLEICWQPLMEGSWRDTLMLESNNKLKKSVPVVFQCISDKKKKILRKGKKKSPIKKLKSPKRTKIRTPPKITYPTKRRNSPIKKVISPLKMNSPRVPLNENYLSPQKNHVHASPQMNNIIPNYQQISPFYLERRETFNIGDKENFNSQILPNIEVNFDDSLEQCTPVLSPRNAFQNNLEQLQLTPLLQFNSRSFVCSSERKDMADKSPIINYNRNLSTETYIKGNISTETYVKGNISAGTYVKGNLSAGTYVIDNSIGNLAALEKSPIQTCESIPKKNLFVSPVRDSAQNIIEANMWSTDKRKEFENIAEKKTSHEFVVPASFNRKRKSSSPYNLSPQKKQTSHSNSTNWTKSAASVKKVKVHKSFNLAQFIQKSNKYCAEEKSVMLHDPDSLLNVASNPYILAATEAVDPFMTATLFYEPRWMDEQEERFKKLLNALLTPPDELATNIQQKIDIAKLWQQCKKLEVSKAPTNEEASIRHANLRLNSIRKNSIELFRTAEISGVLKKCNSMIKANKLLIRKDKDVHLDLGLQYEVMTLFLSYNPLWLRIGLETVFGKTIPLKSNSDILGIGNFLMKNFFKDAYLLNKYKIAYVEKYTLEIKQHILTKFLMFVYFVDKAKLKKLIPFDPCLFCKNAPIKESREIVIRFARELLHAVGDITKFLRLINYDLGYKQTYIHEFEYAIENLGVDLRDGIRLVKVMEIILLENNLTNNLRVPAISRLQKIHNMKIVFDSLMKAGYNILHEITPKDIVDGHKEKTLSFLWQIIYKFQAPRFTKAVITVQNWWRSPFIVIKRNALKNERIKRINAACTIIGWYKRQKARSKLERFIPLLKIYMRYIKQRNAALKIQSYFRMWIQRKKYLQICTCVIILQKNIRKWLIMSNYHQKVRAATQIQTAVRGYLTRKRYLKLKLAVVCIEEKYISNKLMQADFAYYKNLRSATIYVQAHFRANKLMRIEKMKYDALKQAVIFMQREYRANCAMKIARANFLTLKQAVVQIEAIYSAHKIRKSFLDLKHAVITMQQRFRANCAMKMERKNYLLKKICIIKIQRWYRSCLLKRFERNKFIALKQSALIIQNRYRAQKLMMQKRACYNQMRNAVILMQRMYRGKMAMQMERAHFMRIRMIIVHMQLKVKANQAMKKARSYYLQLQKAVMICQQRFRSNCMMKLIRSDYLRLKNTTICIQRRYRANKLMQRERLQYLRLKNATILIQTIFKANKLMQFERNKYNLLKHHVVDIQRKYRGKMLMRRQRNDFVALKQAVIITQIRFRARKLMQQKMGEYQRLKLATVLMQRRFRANRMMLKQRAQYSELKRSTIAVQNRFRANKLMKLQRTKFVALKHAAITIQRRYRANKTMQQCKLQYQQIRDAAVVLQRRFRARQCMLQAMLKYRLIMTSIVRIQMQYKACVAMRKQRAEYVALKQAVIVMQRRYRANKLMKMQREQFVMLKTAVVFTQRRFLANKNMCIQRTHYQQLRNAVIVIQLRYRAMKQMLHERMLYLKLKEAIVVAQRRFRANQLMKLHVRNYSALKNASIIVQRRFRALQAMKAQRNQYRELKNSCLVVQRRYRANKLMQQQHKMFTELRTAVLLVQRRFQANVIMKLHREHYLRVLNFTILIQRKFRAFKMMQSERRTYALLKKSALVIQQRFRANLQMKKEKHNYKLLHEATITIQQRFRAMQAMRAQRMKFQLCKKAAIIIQCKFRAYTMMKMQCEQYRRLREAVVIIQRRFRANVMMKNQRRCYVQMYNAVVKLQRPFRATCEMRVQQNIYNAKRNAAIIIQRQFRLHKLMLVQRSQYLSIINAIVVIQRRYKANLLMRREREIYKIKVRVILKLQTYGRGFLGRKMYNELMDPVLVEARRVAKERKNSATKIQALWRGYRTRSEENKAFSNIRERIKVVNQNLKPQDTLASRSSRAIKIMEDEHSTLHQIIDALFDIDYVTRRDKNKCKSISQLSEFFVSVLLTEGRSVPVINAYIAATSCLLNLSKYPPTSKYTWFPEHIDRILQVMLNNCDKEGILFPYLCTLLWIHVQNKERLQFILGIPKIQQQLQKMLSLCVRQQNMVSRGRYKRQSSVFEHYSKLPVPSLTPDWGIDYKHRPRTFTNSIHAIKSLILLLETE